MADQILKGHMVEEKDGSWAYVYIKEVNWMVGTIEIGETAEDRTE